MGVSPTPGRWAGTGRLMMAGLGADGTRAGGGIRPVFDQPAFAGSKSSRSAA
jgi:hypothetical protein